MAREIETFIEGYRKSLGEGDIESVVAAYRLPLPVIRPDRTVMVTEARVLHAEITKIIDTYRWAGMRTIAIGGLRIDGFDPGMHMVSLTWRPLNEIGEEVAAVDVTYAVRRTMGGARIAAVVAHNEERRRDPLISAWYHQLTSQVAEARRGKT
ncbi:hypothetical protein [Rubrimonas cliftonensis]|uniref:DUF6841 domain-containing protein n=1 Tax=Rubrimonas cliftonensis TaxID=89524 RepID=A0A1H4ARN9_9RHOB|nr:hypothetical protein [Rubrimonas cliftonensis]SEA38468.1 hypothetical protein SAMN05444370_104339 [Rubrimonas cliftonensis]